MSMTNFKLKDILEERLADPEFHTSYNRKDKTFRVEWKDTKEGINIKIPNVVAKYNQRGEEVLIELEDHLKEALRIMNEDHQLKGQEKNIYPVIRSTSFPMKTNAGAELITKEHTAETRIYYALDLGKSYRLIDQPLLAEENWTKDRMDEIGTFNLRSLKNDYRKDSVAGNDFYFIAKQDGYDASRILNDALLKEMYANSKGELAVAVPHQDVLIFADVQNDAGYDILAEMTMKFFAEGRIPITSLPLIYDGETLEPIFILAQKRHKKRK